MRPLIIFSIVLLTFSSCNDFEKIRGSNDFEFKKQKAFEFFDQKKYDKANILLEELLPLHKGKSSFEALYYRYAQTFYLQQNYLAASYHFKNFGDLFPKSPKAEQARFLHAECLFKQSSDYTLEQSNTEKAIGELQNFINAYPSSSKVANANTMIDEARSKLEEKDAYAAKQYYKVSQFRAAALYFEKIINKYPDSKDIDYYQYMVMKSRYDFAKRSVNAKLVERYQKVIDDHEYFMDINSKNQYRSRMEELKSLSSQALLKIKKS